GAAGGCYPRPASTDATWSTGSYRRPVHRRSRQPRHTRPAGRYFKRAYQYSLSHRTRSNTGSITAAGTGRTLLYVPPQQHPWLPYLGQPALPARTFLRRRQRIVDQAMIREKGDYYAKAENVQHHGNHPAGFPDRLA